MKKQNSSKIEKKILLARKHKESLDMHADDQPIRLGEKAVGDKMVFIRKTSDAIFKDVSNKPKPAGHTSGSHSLTALRSFRSK